MLYYYDSFILGEFISELGPFPFIFFITLGFYAGGVTIIAPLFILGLIFMLLFIGGLLAKALELMATFIFGWPMMLFWGAVE